MQTEKPNISVESVKILAVMPAPPMDPIPVGLHYFEQGDYKRTIQKNMRCTWFENLVVSSVVETRPGIAYRLSPNRSARDLARNVVALAKQARASMASPVEYSAPVLDLRSFVPNNMAHLLLDVIPYALLAKQIAGPELIVLTQPVRGPFAELLGLFGLSTIWEERRVTGEVVKISGSRGLAVYDLPSTFDCNGIHFAPSVYADASFHGGPGYEKVFLARRAPRDLANQAEIESLLDRHGYRTIFMEDYPVREQLGIAARAKHVVAVHGAAMSFLLMNKGLESVIELLPPNVYHQLFPTCLGSRVRQYHQVIPEFDPRVAHCGWTAVQSFKSSTFSVNERLLDRLLSEVENGEAAATAAKQGTNPSKINGSIFGVPVPA